MRERKYSAAGGAGPAPAATSTGGVPRELHRHGDQSLAVINEFGWQQLGAARPPAPGRVPVRRRGLPARATAGRTWCPPRLVRCRRAALAGPFIFDVQTHCFDAGEWRTNTSPTRRSSGSSPRAAGQPARLLQPVALRRADVRRQRHHHDGHHVVAGGDLFPRAEDPQQPALACGLPLSNAGMQNLRDWINAKALSQRCINQVQVMPNDFLQHRIEGMYAAVETRGGGAAHGRRTPLGLGHVSRTNGTPRGYFLTDPIGRAFIEAGLKLGIPNFAIHKGLPIPGFDVSQQAHRHRAGRHRLPGSEFRHLPLGINAGTGGTATAALIADADREGAVQLAQRSEPARREHADPVADQQRRHSRPGRPTSKPLRGCSTCSPRWAARGAR